MTPKLKAKFESSHHILVSSVESKRGVNCANPGSGGVNPALPHLVTLVPPALPAVLVLPVLELDVDLVELVDSSVELVELTWRF